MSRPQSPTSSEAAGAAGVEGTVLQAARELLAEGGVKRLTIEGVAARTGVAKTTIYRRWRSKEALALAVILQMTREVVEPHDSGDIRSSLIAFLDRAVTILGTTLMGGVMQGLASDLATDPALATAYHDEVVSLRMARLRVLLRRGVEAGQIREDVDVALVHDLLFGPVYHRLLFTGRGLDEGLATQIVDSVLPGIAAPNAGG